MKLEMEITSTRTPSMKQKFTWRARTSEEQLPDERIERK